MTDPIPQKGQRVGPSPLYYELLAQHAALLSKYEALRLASLAYMAGEESVADEQDEAARDSLVGVRNNLRAVLLAAALKKEGG